MNIYPIDFDIKQRKDIKQTNIFLTQNDTNSIHFQFFLKDNTRRIIPFGHHATIFFEKPDNTYVQGNMQIQNNCYSYLLKGSELSVSGYVIAYIKIYNADGTERLTLQPFRFEVLKDLNSAAYNGIQATSQYEALQEAYNLLNRAKILDQLLNRVSYSLEVINSNLDISNVSCSVKCNTVTLNGEIMVNRLERPLSLFRVPSIISPRKIHKTYALLNMDITQPKVGYITIGTDGIAVLNTNVNTIYQKIILDTRYDID